MITTAQKTFIQTHLGDCIHQEEQSILNRLTANQSLILESKDQNKQLNHLLVAITANSEKDILSKGIIPFVKQYPVGYIWLVITTPKYRNEGLTKASIQNTIDWFKTNPKIEQILFVGWQNPLKNPRTRGYQKAGFQTLASIPNAWRPQCEKVPNYCPAQSPDKLCSCTLHVLEKQINSKQTR